MIKSYIIFSMCNFYVYINRLGNIYSLQIIADNIIDRPVP
jgi:hypothetical protein